MGHPVSTRTDAGSSPAASTMRDEYDFSNGVRGSVYARVVERMRHPLPKREDVGSSPTTRSIRVKSFLYAVRRCIWWAFADLRLVVTPRRHWRLRWKIARRGYEIREQRRRT